jgi:hypothetical protein
MSVRVDSRVTFPAFFVRGSKTAQRRFVHDLARLYLASPLIERDASGEACTAERVGGVMFDIDDTLVDGEHEGVNYGLTQLIELYQYLSRDHPSYIVTARPRVDKKSCCAMLHSKGIYVQEDRLHMLPTHLYGKGDEHVINFKWTTSVDDIKHHLIARFGDKLWDVAHPDTVRAHLSHVGDEDCYVFLDPRLPNCLSCKMPGVVRRAH